VNPPSTRRQRRRARRWRRRPGGTRPIRVARRGCRRRDQRWSRLRLAPRSEAGDERSIEPLREGAGVSERLVRSDGTADREAGARGADRKVGVGAGSTHGAGADAAGTAERLGTAWRKRMPSP
jgi:hypothetical protein